MGSSSNDGETSSGSDGEMASSSTDGDASSSTSSDGQTSASSGTSSDESSDGQTSAIQVDAISLPSGRGRVVWELCCSPESLITACALALGFAAERLTLETGWDLRKREDGCRACREAMEKKVQKSWLSLPCTPWSSMQNLNKRTAKQRKRLRAMRSESILMCEIGLSILSRVVEQGGDMYFEWPSGCHGWRIRPLLAFKKKMEKAGRQLYKCRVDGCAYGLRSRTGDMYLRKRWTILTTDKVMAEQLARKCPGGHEHKTIQGQDTARSAFYPLQMAAKVALVWCHACG